MALSKADLVPPEDADRAAHELRERLGERAIDAIATSSVTGLGLDELASAIFASAREAADGERPPDRLAEPEAEHRLYTPAADEGFEVSRGPDGTFRVTGPRVERLIARHDVENEEALAVIEPVTLGARLLLEPQPAINSAAAKTKQTTRADIGSDSRRDCLNGA